MGWKGVSFGLLGFSRDRRKGSALKNLAGALRSGAIRCKLSVGHEVKTEIPGKTRRFCEGGGNR